MYPILGTLRLTLRTSTLSNSCIKSMQKKLQLTHPSLASFVKILSLSFHFNQLIMKESKLKKMDTIPKETQKTISVADDQDMMMEE